MIQYANELGVRQIIDPVLLHQQELDKQIWEAKQKLKSLQLARQSNFWDTLAEENWKNPLERLYAATLMAEGISTELVELPAGTIKRLGLTNGTIKQVYDQLVKVNFNIEDDEELVAAIHYIAKYPAAYIKFAPTASDKPLRHPQGPHA